MCNHHDLGPLGAAINIAALRRQLTMLKDMGCDAVRTSHNMPAPELVQLCDEMGFMMMLEPFDEWDIAKCENGYHRYFNEWAERYMINMLHQYRNNPCVVIWSIGNEVPTQCSPEGYKVASFLQDICHREDPTRPVTCGMDQVTCVLKNGFAAMIDVPGFNYRAHRYLEAYKQLPQNIVLGSETSSTVSSRGVYKFPVEKCGDAKYEDHQSSGYDLEHCSWSNVPDEDFALADDYDWTIGQFVWTGFDYLGEPTPFNAGTPARSSYFGIVDLAGMKKDRFFLYQSKWSNCPVLHLLPHWNWAERLGQNVPVFCYTNYPEAELFVNGKSMGSKKKDRKDKYERYRLMWKDVIYQPGEIKVVAYDEKGMPADSTCIRTAGTTHRLRATVDRREITADGKDLAYVMIEVVDKEGNLCPRADNMLFFDIEGAASLKAACNGNPTDQTSFSSSYMRAFNGKLMLVVEATETTGQAILKVYGGHLLPVIEKIDVINK